MAAEFSESKRAGDAGSKRVSVSRLESLPAELLEQIFLASANGNLLLAAPRIATRLSGSETLYRAVFTLAFYNHRLRDTLDSLQISFLVPWSEPALNL